MLNGIGQKKLFLIDGLGALLSAFLLGVVLVKFEDIIGMPSSTLYVLASLACIFAAYSLYCYLLLKENSESYLKIIAILNLMYCGLTLGIVIYHHQALTALGLFYFISEIIVVTTLAIAELKIGNRARLHTK